MGYRSDVAYVINFKDKELRNEFVVLVKTHGGNLMEALNECMFPECAEGDAQINFYAEDVKWYESYTDVKSHHDLMDKALDWFEEGVGIKFIRIGEESNDIVEEESGDTDYVPYDSFYPITTLELPFKPDGKTYREILSDSTTNQGESNA